MKCVQRCFLIVICLAIQAFGQSPSVTDLPQAVVGLAYKGAVTFDVKTSPPIHMDLAGKLPDGLSMNSDGTIRGKAAKAGTAKFGVFLSDANGPVVSGIFSLQVNDPSAGASSTATGCENSSSGEPVALKDRCYNDRDETFQIVAGAEQSGVASLPNQTNAFMSAFTRAGLDWPMKIWARIRLLGEPTASTGGVISAFQDPTGQIKNLDTQKVGQAVDFVVGPDYQFKTLTSNSGRYSVHFIGSIGATTPLSSEDVVSKFAVPLKSSPQCAVIASRFTPQNGYPANLILPNTDPASTNCLANGITVLAFNRQERSNFLRKYSFGFRTIERFKSNDDAGNPTICCQRGIVDFVVGQDEAITGGKLQGWVFRIDGIHPLPIAGKSYLYLFGTASLKLSHNHDLQTLILDADTSAATPASSNVALLPLKQPNKDFYRFGVGLNINQVFSKLFQ